MAEAENQTHDIFETVGDLNIALFVPEWDPKKIELSEAGKKAREQFEIESDFQPLKISRLREFIEKEVYGYIQMMKYECTQCENRAGEESATAPYKCDECGSRRFERIPEFNAKTDVFGPLTVSFYEKDDELYLEFANKNTSTSKIIVQDVLNRLTGLTNTLRRIEKKLDELEEEKGEFDIDMAESRVSGSQRNRLQTVKQIIKSETAGDESVNIQRVLDKAEEEDIPKEKTKDVINRLKNDGELFEPEEGKVQRI